MQLVLVILSEAKDLCNPHFEQKMHGFFAALRMTTIQNGNDND